MEVKTLGLPDPSPHQRVMSAGWGRAIYETLAPLFIALLASYQAVASNDVDDWYQQSLCPSLAFVSLLALASLPCQHQRNPTCFRNGLDKGYRLSTRIPQDTLVSSHRVTLVLCRVDLRRARRSPSQLFAR